MISQKEKNIIDDLEKLRESVGGLMDKNFNDEDKKAVKRFFEKMPEIFKKNGLEFYYDTVEALTNSLLDLHNRCYCMAWPKDEVVGILDEASRYHLDSFPTNLLIEVIEKTNPIKEKYRTEKDLEGLVGMPFKVAERVIEQLPEEMKGKAYEVVSEGTYSTYLIKAAGEYYKNENPEKSLNLLERIKEIVPKEKLKDRYLTEEIKSFFGCSSYDKAIAYCRTMRDLKEELKSGWTLEKIIEYSDIEFDDWKDFGEVAILARDQPRQRVLARVLDDSHPLKCWVLYLIERGSIKIKYLGSGSNYGSSEINISEARYNPKEKRVEGVIETLYEYKKNHIDIPKEREHKGLESGECPGNTIREINGYGGISDYTLEYVPVLKRELRIEWNNKEGVFEVCKGKELYGSKDFHCPV